MVVIREKLMSVGGKVQWLTQIRDDVNALIKSLTPLVSDTRDSN